MFICGNGDCSAGREEGGEMRVALQNEKALLNLATEKKIAISHSYTGDEKGNKMLLLNFTLHN